MGVDSGLPDFRGPQGFWRAYPPYERLGLNFAALANPRWFVRRPRAGLGLLRPPDGPLPPDRAARGVRDPPPMGRAHAARRVRVHVERRRPFPARPGSIPTGSSRSTAPSMRMQCMADCGIGIFPSEPYEVAIDEETMRAVPPLPACPKCGGLARPNILMFGDRGWDSSRSDAQHRRLAAWLRTLDGARVGHRRAGRRDWPSRRSGS